MESTSGLFMRSKNCRAYAERDSTKRRCPSAYIVSKASDDFPDPLTPVTTTSELRGISSDISFKLCCRAPRTEIILRTGERSGGVFCMEVSDFSACWAVFTAANKMGGKNGRFAPYKYKCAYKRAQKTVEVNLRKNGGL